MKVKAVLLSVFRFSWDRKIMSWEMDERKEGERGEEEDEGEGKIKGMEGE